MRGAVRGAALAADSAEEREAAEERVRWCCRSLASGRSGRRSVVSVCTHLLHRNGGLLAADDRRIFVDAPQARLDAREVGLTVHQIRLV